jgi:hypothetical protein
MVVGKTPKSGTAGNPRMPTHGLRLARDIAINVFLVFHIVAITCWCLPINSVLVLECRQFLRPYFLCTGLFQSWDMFSPNPKSVNSYVDAVIIYKDGSTENWTFPRMQLLDFTERYYRERYRKFEENLVENDHSALWPDAARYIARQHGKGPAPPQTVMLVVRWSNVVQRDDGTFERTPWDAHVFYSYAVKPEDLN